MLNRVAGAPISWGVCEVPGWGHQMSADRVLGEMREAGLVATEFGPEGFLPAEPQAKADRLAAARLSAVGGFVPVVLHDPDLDLRATLLPTLESFVAARAGTLVLSADAGAAGYDERVELDDPAWRVLFDNLDRIGDLAGERGVTATLHPHVGTVVERTPEVERVLEGAALPLCLDTGHLLIGGTDPAALAREVPGRVAHVHLKDVDAALADRVRNAELTYTEAVARGLYRPLGQGDVDIAGIVRSLEGAGYQGWYVMEQDTILDAEPAPGEGPLAAVQSSLDYLKGLQA
ncbi:MAG: TIM barrel protein [Actinomycetota bacterium]|jgi:inosose dehydratase|nr:TIM barrel protein [Actinomycetota bacterium]